MTSASWEMVGGPPDLPVGHEGIRVLFEHIGEIDQTWTIDDVIAEGDKVVVRATNTCVQEGFFGVPGSGITQVFSATFILQFADGLVTTPGGTRPTCSGTSSSAPDPPTCL